MAKTNKTICIDVGLIDELQKISNASGLINDLLMEYFGAGNKSSIDDLKKRILKEEENIRNATENLEKLKATLEKFEKKERLTKQIFKNIPEEIFQDFLRFGENINWRSRFNEIWGRKYSITREEVQKAYNEYFKKGDENGS